MTTETDLEQMDLDDLKQLQKNVNRAIQNFEARRHREALAAARQTAKEHGFNLEDLLKAPAKGGKPATLPAKYASKEDPSLTWSGRGRQPNWVKDVLKSGRKIEEFEI